MASQVAQWQRIRLPMQEMQVQSLGQEDPLEKKMAALSNTLGWIHGQRNWKAAAHGATKSQIQLNLHA